MNTQRANPETRGISGHYLKTDCAVIGGGLAGCSAAIELADQGCQVDLFVKGRLIRESNSYLLAGGLASVPFQGGKPLSGDSLDLHVRETLLAGSGLNQPDVVKAYVARFFPDVIEWLIQKGVTFDAARTGFPFHLHREGGHSRNRIFHVQDQTGSFIMEALVRHVIRHPRIRLHEEHMSVDLITRNKLQHKRGKDECLGVYVYDVLNHRVRSIAARGVFLATGGLGKVFLYTTNADVSSGDGFAMCARAGLPLMNMEFVQFHPSVFYDDRAAGENERRFLLTEALRGAGAIVKLHRDDQKDLILDYDRRGSVATRDVVCRAMDKEMRKYGLKHLWLDCTRIQQKKLMRDFRGAFEYCKAHGVNMSKDPVPIVYAVHYSNGGVATNDRGETGLKGCYVMGETACSGLHGATRLASNSGPECVLMGRMAAQAFCKSPRRKEKQVRVPLWDSRGTGEARDLATVAYYWETVRRTMTSLCGVSRHGQRLGAALEVLRAIRENINAYYWSYRVGKDFLEVRNIADVAMAIVTSALARKETRACHFREDFPETKDPEFKKISLFRTGRKVSFQSADVKTRPHAIS